MGADLHLNCETLVSDADMVALLLMVVRFSFAKKYCARKNVLKLAI